MEENNVPVVYSVDTHTARKTFSTLGLALFAVAAVTTVLQVGAGALFSYLAEQGKDIASESWFIWAMTFIPLYLVGVPTGLLIMRTLPVSEKTQIKLGAKNFWVFMLMCFPLMYIGNLIGTLLSSLLSGGTAENTLLEYVFDDSPLKILVVVILAPLVEEYLFRKQIIDRCRRYGEKQAILFSAMAFGLFHMNLYQFFYAFGLGLLFAYIYTRTGKLHYSVIMHMVVNLLGSVVAPLLLSRVDLDVINSYAAGQPLDEAAIMSALPGLLGFTVYVFALIGLSIAGLVLIITKAKKLVFVEAEEELPKKESFRTVYINCGVILFTLLCVGVAVWSLV